MQRKVSQVVSREWTLFSTVCPEEVQSGRIQSAGRPSESSSSSTASASRSGRNHKLVVWFAFQSSHQREHTLCVQNDSSHF